MEGITISEKLGDTDYINQDEEARKKRIKLEEERMQMVMMQRKYTYEAAYCAYKKKSKKDSNFEEFENLNSVAEFMNYMAMSEINKSDIDDFHKMNCFFSLFTAEEIAAGLPSNETLSFASKEQVECILWDSIVAYGSRITLLGDKLQYLDVYQVSKLTKEQIQSIENEKINFPENSPIAQKLSGNLCINTELLTESREKSKCCILT